MSANIGNVLKHSDLRECCDTCDSKNDKTPVDACVRARAREGDYRYFYNSYSHCFHHSSKLEKYPPIAWKKQAVVFNKTTRRFQQNKPLIEKKEVEIAYKKWIEKRNRRCFIKGKLQCVFEFCLGGEILLAPFTSMSGILFLYETKRDAAKTSFATSPVFIILHHRKSVCSEVNLRIRG